MDVRRALSGLTVITIGLILLANTMGYAPWTVWWNVLSLWPLLLVAAGVDLIGRSLDMTWISVLGSLVIIGGLLYSAFLMPASGPTALWWSGPLAGTPYSQELKTRPGSEGVVLNIDVDAATIAIRPGKGSTLIRVSGRRVQVPAGRTSSLSGLSYAGAPSGRTQHGYATNVAIDQRRGTSALPYASTLNIALDAGTRWREVAVTGGASTFDADLSRLDVEKMDLKTGAATVDTTAGVQTSVVNIDAGVASVALRVPTSADVTIIQETALVATDFRGFERVSQDGKTVWHRPATHDPTEMGLIPSSSPRITIDLRIGVGTASVSPY